MANFKVMGVGMVSTFVVALLQGIFIPLIQRKYERLKDTAPSEEDNESIDDSIELLYILPILTLVFGLIVSVVAGFLTGKR